MRTIGFPACCGAAILFSLFENGDYGQANNLAADIQKIINEGASRSPSPREQQLLWNVPGRPGNSPAPRYVDAFFRTVGIAITNPTEIEQEKILLGLRAKMVASFVNGNVPQNLLKIWIIPFTNTAQITLPKSE